MKRNFRFISLLLIFVLMFSTFSFSLAAETSSTEVITILQTSDIHNRIYPYNYPTDSYDNDAGLALVSTVVNNEREKDSDLLLIDTGDTIQDNMGEIFNDNPVHPTIEAMNFIGYDAWTIGNHEFNYGLDFLDRNIEAFEGEALSANIKVKSTGDPYVAPYVIFDVDGIQVAVIGLTPPKVPVWEASNPDNFKGLAFESTTDAIDEVLTEIEGQYDVLVGSFHMGDSVDYEGFYGLEDIAKAFPEFDVMFGGHDHSDYQEVYNGVQAIAPGRYGANVSKAVITLKKDAQGNYTVHDVETELISTKGLEPDAELQDQLAYAHEESLAYANETVGVVTADFILRPDYITGEDDITTMPTSQIEDTAVISLINEVQMFYADADVSSAALFNFGSNLKEGDFKRKDAAYIYKYDNTLMGVEITGANLLEYMEWSTAYYNTYESGDATVSFNPEIRGYNYDMFTGIDYTIDLTKEAGERIMNPTIKGMPLDMDATYKLAVNNYRYGTLLGLDLVTEDDIYYDSYAALQDQGRMRDLIIKYAVEEMDGVVAPHVNDNWSVSSPALKNPYQIGVHQLVMEGTVEIPTSEDGRTLNVEALNAIELVNEGVLNEIPHYPISMFTEEQVAGYTADGEIYIVVPGDVLWKIAEKHDTTWEALAEINNLANPDLIHPGQEIQLGN